MAPSQIFSKSREVLRGNDMPASVPFGIFFAVILIHAFAKCNTGISVNTRTNEKFCNAACLKSKTEMHELILRFFL